MNDHPNSNIKAIVLSGGGPRGAYHLGVLNYLERKKILDEIEIFVGSSVGSIIAYLSVLGYSSREIYNYVVNEDISFMAPHGDNVETMGKDGISILLIKAILNVGGLGRPTKIEAMLERLTIQKGHSVDISFTELYLSTHKTLSVVASNVSDMEEVHFNRYTYPFFGCLDAIKASISIPLLYSPMIFENGKWYVDGSMTNDLPLLYTKSLLERQECYEPRKIIAIRLAFEIGENPLFNNYYNLLRIGMISRIKSEARLTNIPVFTIHSQTIETMEYKKAIKYMFDQGKKAFATWFKQYICNDKEEKEKHGFI